MHPVHCICSTNISYKHVVYTSLVLIVEQLHGNQISASFVVVTYLQLQNLKLCVCQMKPFHSDHRQGSQTGSSELPSDSESGIPCVANINNRILHYCCYCGCLLQGSTLQYSQLPHTYCINFNWTSKYDGLELIK